MLAQHDALYVRKRRIVSRSNPCPALVYMSETPYGFVAVVWTSFPAYALLLPGTWCCLVMSLLKLYNSYIFLHVRDVHRDQMLIEFKDPQHTAANTVYPLDTADEAALHPEAKTLAVLQHNGFSARLVRSVTSCVQCRPALWVHGQEDR